MDMMLRLIIIENNVLNTKLNKVFKHSLPLNFLLIDLFDPKNKITFLLTNLLFTYQHLF